MQYIMYGVTVILLILSYRKDKIKTKKALKKAWKAFLNILPQLLPIIMLVGIMLSVFDAEVISKILGSESGFVGTMIAAIVGSVTLIPGFVAFPAASMLLEKGSGYMQIAVFVSTLMMVGVVTMPIEITYFGKKLTIYRNIFAFAFSFFVAFIIGKVAGGIWFT